MPLHQAVDPLRWSFPPAPQIRAAHATRLCFQKQPVIRHNGIRQGNRNPLLYKSLGVDGLKTGHTENAGFCLAASAKQGDRRLIMVVGGLSSMQERSDESERILNWGFRQFDNYALFAPGEEVTQAEVWLGQQQTVPLVSGDDVIVTLPRSARADMKVTASYDGPIPAPMR